MPRRRGVVSVLAVLGSAALLLWPAILNGYPLLFGDTGVYLQDGVQLHMSWARPLFYGLFMLPLHLKLTAWPVIVAQALITACVLLVAIRCFLPGRSDWVLVPVTLVLSVATSLPWFVAQLMPDVFGGLIVLALAALILTPERLGRTMQVVAALFAIACATMHLTFVPIALAVVVVLWAVRLATGAGLRGADLLRGASVPGVAIATVVAANAVLLGQPSLSPYGKIFVLVRVLEDGPGARALQRECPRPGWTLCALKDQLTPGDAMLWGEASVLSLAGGHRVVAAQAWPIILSAARAEPGAMLVNTLRNTAEQFVSFRSGDALLKPSSFNEGAWTATFPPAEQERYFASRQYRRLALVPDWLQAIHLAVGGAGVAALAIAACVGLGRRQTRGGLCAALLTALVANAFLAGALSGVYDRYQSRFVWLAAFATVLMALGWERLGRRFPLRGPSPAAPTACS